jgi:predicted enzyme related to lactoylglutathione lyase
MLSTDLENLMTDTTTTPTAITAASTQTITAYISVRNPAAALAFYAEAFEAVEVSRLVGDDGRIGHAEITMEGKVSTAAKLWFVVDGIHAAAAKVRELGGSADEPVLYDSGWAADCAEDQGTAFSLSVPTAKYTL